MAEQPPQSQSPVPSPVPQQAAPPVPPKQGSSKTLIAVLIAVVVTLLVVGVGVGVWVFVSVDDDVNVETSTDTDTKELQSAIEELQADIDDLSSSSSDSSSTTTTDTTRSDYYDDSSYDSTSDTTTEIPIISGPGTKPEQVVDNYLNTVMGTLPGSSIDYDLAQTYMSSSYAPLFDESGFIPQSLCIQNGPEEIIAEDVSTIGDASTVRISASFGPGDAHESMWDFDLVMEAGEWKINSVTCL